MTNLISTYRFQFHREFRFEEFGKLLPYLARLGVGTVYASPVFTSVPGSTHGYDGLDPHQVNPEIGTREQLEALSNQLKAEGINWLQDIVPNHMAFDPRNQWLMDVLEKGPQSIYAPYFDIAWSSALYQGRIMVPFLGNTLDQVIENNELKLACEAGRIVFKYYDAAYPLQPLSYSDVLTAAEKTPEAIQQLVAQIPKDEDARAYGEAWQEFRMQLAALYKNEKTRDYIDKCLQKLGEDKEWLRRIEAQQSYRLCHWQETDQRINYRRFFTVNGLICLNIQDPGVFEAYHQLVRELVEQNIFQGLRVDHIDGLYDPGAYLQQLRGLAGEETPIFVEKILEPGEGLPKIWPVQGNTGYDFLSLVNNLLTNRHAEKKFNRFYRHLTKDNRSIHEQVLEKKAYILSQHMGGELENLYQLFRQSNIVDKRSLASVRPEDLKEVIGEFLVHCPVYRYYGTAFPLEGEEAAAVQDTINRVRAANHELRRAVDVLEQVLLWKPQEGNEEINARIAAFYQRCMQFSGPLMAKGVEDTLMYTYSRFIGHNEVGDSPESFGISVDEFHAAMVDRQQHWPFSLNATSTHDTKRGEDARARLNVLTDLPDEWLDTVKEWQQQNAGKSPGQAPDANDEYFIYQTLVGAHPFPHQEDNFAERVGDYLQKALREAKLHSNWTTPDEEYENAAKNFARSLLNSPRENSSGLHAFLEKIVDHGIVNSLVQSILKFTCPGIPDVYQGCELWDLSLVDPDNRRPVDFDTRIQWLDELEAGADPIQLWEKRYEGKIKLWLTQVLFRLRRQNPALFTSGEYIPLKADGIYKDHIIAFARKYRQHISLVVLPLHTAIICREQETDLLSIDWKDTRIYLPEGADADWTQLLTGQPLNAEGSLLISELFQPLPFALLKGQKVTTSRGAGILLHISSLPSRFGIGDLGPEARAFADFLQRSRQKYWQLLPLSPTEEGQGHSPYSSISSRAGNVLFISPELLMKEGLLSPADLQPLQLPNEGHVDYAGAEKLKSILFEKAWQAYRQQEQPILQKEFRAFAEKEKEWLDDFALYALLKQENGGKPWYEWEEDLKFHKEEALRQLEAEHEDSLQKIKWLQFIFSRQWQAFKDHCNAQGIELIGDMPFYVSYDSADVWSHRRLFALDEEGNRTGMAGVPPDDFSADGQLWGMPVFQWELHSEEGYRWWIDRLKKNVELFDIVRLDHFRAFSAYWEVPAGEATARNGKWVEGPGAAFFSAVQEALGSLPFVAEDLGEIDEPVYQLRDSFRLPGMKVLQFAFGGDMPRSVHIPHNYGENFLVYTGTHDNNTTRGWFTEEAGDEARLALERYAGRPLSAAEVTIVLARMAYASVARVAILPVQDLLNLDGSARMNRPGSGENNWAWRLLPGQVEGIAERNLRHWTRLYNRE